MTAQMHSIATETPERWPAAWPAPSRIAGAGLGAFAIASVVANLLNPGYDPLREGVSALAATGAPAAGVMIAGFLALAAGTTAAGAVLWGRLRTGLAGRVGAALVMLCGAAMVVVGLNQQDCSDMIGACAAAEQAGTLSEHHMVHQLTSLAVFTVLALAAFPLARGLRRSGTYAHLAGATRVAGSAALGLTVAMVVVGFGDLAGVAQRIFLLLVFGWPVLLAALPARHR
jgi:hypothetical protein